jgi:hypothetical protein
MRVTTSELPWEGSSADVDVVKRQALLNRSYSPLTSLLALEVMLGQHIPSIGLIHEL